MLNFRSIAVLSLILLAVIGGGLSSPAAPEVAPINITPGKADRPITLRDQLVVGLQARLKSEVAFCDSVTTKVQAGQLPRRVVDETFLWARLRAASIRNGHKYRPIVYFQPAMNARANLLHVSL
jgi:hypothetical protein